MIIPTVHSPILMKKIIAQTVKFKPDVAKNEIANKIIPSNKTR